MAGAADLVGRDGDDVVVAVHVQPGAGRSAIVGRHGDALKVRVAAPPLENRANEAAIALIAAVLDVPARDIEVLSGARSRVKRLKVRGIDLETTVDRVERALEDAATPPGPRERRAR
jgi:uncharacterized protein (TIGR00251 family)